MSDREGHLPDETGPSLPLSELADLALDPDAELPGLVQRSIQRREFVADTLDFSITMLFATFWAFVQSCFESFGRGRNDREDP